MWFVPFVFTRRWEIWIQTTAHTYDCHRDLLYVSQSSTDPASSMNLKTGLKLAFKSRNLFPALALTQIRSPNNPPGKYAITSMVFQSLWGHLLHIHTHPVAQATAGCQWHVVQDPVDGTTQIGLFAFLRSGRLQMLTFNVNEGKICFKAWNWIGSSVLYIVHSNCSCRETVIMCICELTQQEQLD